MAEHVPTWTPKPWGGELLMRLTGAYAVKILHLNAGCRTSLQYHRVKRETLLPGSGQAVVEIHRDGRVESGTLEAPVTLLPGTVHRLTAIHDADIVEVSSIELDDVVRVEDDYGRSQAAAGSGD